MDFGPKTAKFGPKLTFLAKYWHFWPIWSSAWPKNNADKLPSEYNSTAMSAAFFKLWWWVRRPQMLHCLGELFSIVSAAQQQMIIMTLHISVVIEMLAQCTCLSILSNIKWILLLFLFQNSTSTPVTVVDVPPILNKTIKSGHHLCFFGVKLRINWFDKLLIITTQPTRGWLIRPK